MAVAKWTTPSTRSSNIASTVINSIATGSETAVVTYDNSTNRNLYGAVTLKLGTFGTATVSGGSVSLRVTLSDGTDTADKLAGDVYTAQVTASTTAKVVVFPMIRLYPFSLRFSIINNTGQTTASSGNELYVTPYNEEVT